jgi:ABC-type polysaccharide/polyol phosphate export permease
MIVVVYLAVVATLFVGVVFVAWKLVEAGNLGMWDVALFMLPLVLSVTLLQSGIRPKSLANLFEPFVVVLIVLVAFLVRAFGFSKYRHEVRAIWATVLCTGAAIGIYVLIPGLSE